MPTKNEKDAKRHGEADRYQGTISCQLFGYVYDPPKNDPVAKEEYDRAYNKAFYGN